MPIYNTHVFDYFNNMTPDLRALFIWRATYGAFHSLILFFWIQKNRLEREQTVFVSFMELTLTQPENHGNR